MQDIASIVSNILTVISYPQITSIQGDFLIRNETVESKFSIYNWPRVHRLEFKIENHDDLLSFAQIDILDNDVSNLIIKFLWQVEMEVN